MEAREAEKASEVVARADQNIRQLRDNPEFKKHSVEASVLRTGALLLGLMIPQQALGYGPHERVDELNQMISGVEQYQNELRRERVRYERQHKEYQVQQVDNELERTEALQDRLRDKRDSAAERVVKAHERKSERLEKKGKNPLELYDRASDRVDAYLHDAGVEENGRALVLRDADGTQKFIDVPFEYEIYGFDYDGREELTIILQKADGTFYGVFLDQGEYVNEAPVNNHGAKL